MLRIGGQTAGPIGLEFFCVHSLVAGGGGVISNYNESKFVKMKLVVLYKVNLKMSACKATFKS